MKNYEEMSDDVFRRIDEYNVKKQRKKKIITRTLVPVLSICLVALIGIGAWQGGAFSKAPVQGEKEGKENLYNSNESHGNISTDKPNGATVDVTAKIPAKNTNSVQTESSGSFCLTSPYKTDSEKFAEQNSVVIYGKVVDTDYVFDDSRVFTKSQVEILKCYKGEFNSGDTIYVKEWGGFVPSDVMSNAINTEKYDSTVGKSGSVDDLLEDVRVEGFKVMEKGEEVILFLVPITQTDNKEFKNCYDLIRFWQGKLLYEEKFNAFIPYCPSWDLAKDNKANDNASVKIESVGTNENGAQVRAYTLEEFDSFAQQMK